MLHKTNIDEALLMGAGATLVAGSVIGRRTLSNFFEYRQSRELAIAQSASRFAFAVSAALYGAHRPKEVHEEKS